jgi:hypothetical protein
MRIRGDEVFRPAMQVGEITSSATGYENLLADSIRMFDEGDTASALACLNGTHQAGGSATENNCVINLSLG